MLYFADISGSYTHTHDSYAHRQRYSTCRLCTVITYIHITLHIRNPYRQLPQRTSSPLVEPLMPWPLCGSNCCKHSIDPHACNGVTSGRKVIRRGGSLVDNLSINLTPPPPPHKQIFVMVWILLIFYWFVWWLWQY